MTNQTPINDPVKELSEEEVPEDIKEALNVILGNKPKSFSEDFIEPVKAPPPFKGAGFAGGSAQEEFVKKRDAVEKRVRFTENRIYILDLTSESDRQSYSEILDVVFNPESGIVLVEPLKDPEIMVDTNSPSGYRAIITIKTAKPNEYLKKMSSSYSANSDKK
jgi:hypothetical protein